MRRVLGLVFSIPSQEIGLGKPLRNDLFLPRDARLCIRGTSHGPVSVCLAVYPQLVRGRFVYDTYKTMEATRSRHG